MVIRDQLFRPLTELRISVTDRCNLRCRYCMPAEVFGHDYAFLPKSEILSYEELSRICAVFTQLGVEKVRITGGEPLLRRNLEHLVESLNQIENLSDIALTTNGVFLSQQAQKLADVGLKRVNVSLDALDNTILSKISGRTIDASTILAGIEAALEAGLKLKVNMVVHRDLNESQILPMARHFKAMGITLRFIEFMDVGNHNQWDASKTVTEKEILTCIRKEFSIQALPDDNGQVAKRYSYSDDKNEFGVIASVSRPFCNGCGRIRLSSDGKLYTCLFAQKGYDLRKPLRDGVSDAGLTEIIKSLWGKRTDRYSEERSSAHRTSDKVEMSYIGG